MRHAWHRRLSFAVAVLACASLATAADVTVAVGESVQAAIDKAPQGATITLPEGAFTETLTITKPLTLQGAGWEKTVVGPEKLGAITQKDKDDFFTALEAAKTPEERVKLAVAFAMRRATPTLTVKNTAGVTLRGIKFRGPPTGTAEGGLTPESLITFDKASGTISQCAVVGPFMNGVTISEGSDVTIEQSLVAAMWGTGVAAARGSKLRMIESDVRNCYHRCVTLATDDATIEKCRISGSAWHGIRYDNCSPTIVSNLIFGNARSGIYASGNTSATVRGNVFWRNEMDAMSCWFDNKDAVEGNTVVGNLREGISVLGASKTKLVRNVFVDNPVGVRCSKIASGREQQDDAPTGAPGLEGNFFFKNPKDVLVDEAPKSLPEGNETAADPKLGDETQNFKLAADSPARQAKAGAPDPIDVASPFAIQPEEKAIIPDSETRDFSKWKKLASAR